MSTIFEIVRNLVIISEGCLSIILAVIILRKSPQERLNQLFSLVFLLLTLFFLPEVPISLLGSLGTESLIFLPLLNLLRVISSFSAILGAGIFFLVSLFVSRGAQLLENRLLVGSYIGALIILAIIGQLDDHVDIDVANATFILKDGPLGLLICFILPALLIIGATLQFGVLWYNLEDPVLKRNVMFFFAGLCIILLAILYQTFFIILFGSEFFKLYPLLDSLVYILWALGELVAAQGFLRKQPA